MQPIPPKLQRKPVEKYEIRWFQIWIGLPTGKSGKPAVFGIFPLPVRSGKWLTAGKFFLARQALLDGSTMARAPTWLSACGPHRAPPKSIPNPHAQIAPPPEARTNMKRSGSFAMARVHCQSAIPTAQGYTTIGCVHPAQRTTTRLLGWS